MSLTLEQSLQGLTTLAGMFSAGLLVHFLPWHRITLVCATALLVTFCGAMLSIKPGEQVKAGFAMGLASYSIGIIEVVARALLPLSCPDEDIGAAIGLLGSIGFGAAAVASKWTDMHPKPPTIRVSGVNGVQLLSTSRCSTTSLLPFCPQMSRRLDRRRGCQSHRSLHY